MAAWLQSLAVSSLLVGCGASVGQIGSGKVNKPALTNPITVTVVALDEAPSGLPWFRA